MEQEQTMFKDLRLDITFVSKKMFEYWIFSYFGEVPEGF